MGKLIAAILIMVIAGFGLWYVLPLLSSQPDEDSSSYIQSEESFSEEDSVDEDSSADGEHTHVWDNGVITVVPTCETVGEITYSCGCGLTETAEVEALGHDYVDHARQSATCTEIGWNAYQTCERAGCEYTTYVEIPALDHNYVEHAGQAATCLEDGWAAYQTCDRLGCTYTTYMELPATGHTYTMYIIDATCGTQGYTSHVCACGYATTDNYVPALGHNYVDHAGQAPTCTEDGWGTYQTCDRAGCTYTTYQAIPAIGHDYVNHDGKAVTCTENGWAAYQTCGRDGCDYNTYQELSALGHNYVDHAGQAATCTADGWEAYQTCDRFGCTYSTYQEISVLGHNYVDHAGQAPTCTENGWEAYQTCDRFGCTYSTYQEIPALGHNYVDHNGKAATCTESGWETYQTCDRIGCTYSTYQEIPALGHDYVDHNGKAATCTENGWEAYQTCDRFGCTYSTYQEIPALGHDYVNHDGKAATCTENGWKAYQTCGREGCAYTTYEAIPARGHSYVISEMEIDDEECIVITCENCDFVEIYGDDGVIHPHTYINKGMRAATCTEKGISAWFECVTCNKTIKRETPALGHLAGDTYYNTNNGNHYCYCMRANCGEKLYGAHSYHNYEITLFPTCTEDGIKTGVCRYCGDEKDFVVLARHAWNDGDVVEEATCVNKGIMIYRCMLCDGEYETETPALGHNWTDWEETITPNCTTLGKATSSCTRCGETRTQTLSYRHNWGAWVTTKEATCTENGHQESECLDCGETRSNTLIMYHNWSAWRVTKTATCSEAGTKERTCSRCDAVDTESFFSAHRWCEHIDCDDENCDYAHVVKDPTCTEGAEKQYTCLDCGATWVIKYSALGHDWKTVTNQVATCTTMGYKLQECRRCGELSETETSALGHNLYWAYDKDWHWVACARCDLSSMKLNHDLYHNYEKETSYVGGEKITEFRFYELCRTCEYKKQIGESARHEHEAAYVVEGVLPTCTEDGHTAGLYCAVDGCGEVFYAVEVLPALGHDWYEANCLRCGETQLEMLLSDDGTYYTVMGIGQCTGTAIAIPATYKGIEVTTIAENAFKDCAQLTRITIGESITSIGNYAFYMCTSLTEIIYNATECADLISSNYAFYEAGQNGSGIVVTIGANVTKIPARLFASYSNSDSPKVVNVEFEEGSVCESIGNYAFSICANLTSVEIPDSVTTIGDYAFRHCTSLTSVVIPDSVTTIGSYVFKDCYSLQYTEYGNCKYLGNENNPYVALISPINDDITSCIIHEDTKVIAYSAFYSSRVLTEIIYNATECADLSFSNQAFRHAGQNGSGIAVTIGANVKKIPANLFYCGDCIVSVEFETGSVCESIGEYAFVNCSSLTSVEIPDSVTTIGKMPFIGCGILTEIKYNARECEDLSYESFVFSNVGKNGEGVKVTIGANVKKIPAYLFSGHYANSHLPNIISVEFEEGSVCESIGVAAFYACDRLTSVEIPDSVTTIGDGAFENCSSLTSVVIPDSVTSIGDYAFSGCYKLVEVCNKSSLNITQGSVEYGYVGYYAKNIYTLTSGESKLSNDNGYLIYTDGEEKILLGYHGMETDLVLPSYITQIYQYAFVWCSSLTSVVIPDSVTSIGECAFYSCDNLTSVVIGDGVTTIGDGAFSSCSSLTSVVIGDSVTTIGDYAFENCRSLTSITFNGTVEEWNAISKGAGWKYSVPATEVVCDDGVVAI